jgi:transposase
LDLSKQGFLNTSGGICAGQPAYPPEALLKLYLYGYINKVRSSRTAEQFSISLQHKSMKYN